MADRLLTSIKTIIIVIAIGFGAAATAQQRTHGLLIGVSEYPSLGESRQLAGPRNDVLLYRQLLIDRGVSETDIIALADGVDGADLPNRSAILGALTELGERAREGDFVFILVAGHGSQQPTGEGEGLSEPDGLDEIFLPRDVGSWEGTTGSVKNAIVDDEFGAGIEQIRAKGAFVLAVFDTCHSGTITRALPVPGQRDRKVRPADLGIPDSVLTAASVYAGGAERSRGGAVVEVGAIEGLQSNVKKGQYVALYAANSAETTPELLLPSNALDAVPRGLFSYTLYESLTARPGITYRQAIEQVMQRYLTRGIQTPSPSYEGTALNATVFGSAVDAGPRQWRIDRQGETLRLRAGLIHGVTQGSILAVFPDATSPAEDHAGYVEVVAARTADADVRPVEYKEESAPASDLFKTSKYARPEYLKVDFRLRVARPVDSEFCDPPTELLARSIEQLRSSSGERITWVDAGAPADVRLCQLGPRLVFLDAAASLDLATEESLPYLDVPTGDQATDSSAAEEFTVSLESYLGRIARVTNLLRVASRTGAGEYGQLDVSIIHCAAGAAECGPNGTEVSPQQRPTLFDGERLLINLANPGYQYVDVTVLYIDAAYGIGVLYPYKAGETPRLEPKARVSFDITLNAEPSGFEKVLVIAVPVERQSPVQDYTALEQDSIPWGASRGARDGLQDLLLDAAFGSDARGAMRGQPRREAGHEKDRATFIVYAWNIREE